MILQLFRRTPSWQEGLTHIWCTGCGWDLDWAQPEFLALHPDPVCTWCPLPAEPVRPEPAEPIVIHAQAEVIRTVPLADEQCPVNAAFEQAVIEAEVLEP